MKFYCFDCKCERDERVSYTVHREFGCYLCHDCVSLRNDNIDRSCPRCQSDRGRYSACKLCNDILDEVFRNKSILSEILDNLKS